MFRWNARISEHLEISYRSGIRLIPPPFSPIRNHINNKKGDHQNYTLTSNQFKEISGKNLEF